MEFVELKKLRREQIGITNGLLLGGCVIYFSLVHFSPSMSYVFLFFAILLLVEAIRGILKGDSTKSWIPIYERIAEYEKQKMGHEWLKQRRLSYFSQLFLSGLMFYQTYSSWNTEHVVDMPVGFFVIFVFLIGGMVNIAMMLHIRKVDRSVAVSELQGYTWKSTLQALVFGILGSFLMIWFILFYIQYKV